MVFWYPSKVLGLRHFSRISVGGGHKAASANETHRVHTDCFVRMLTFVPKFMSLRAKSRGLNIRSPIYKNPNPIA